MSGLEDQPIRSAEIEGELALTIFSQLVTTPRKHSHDCEMLGGSELVEPSTKHLRGIRAKSFDEIGIGRELSRETLRRKKYIHE